MKRRQFLQSIPAIVPIINLQPATPNPQPVIISTWDFGKKANNVSWSTLQQGGSALDAVEKGINLIEEDPDNLTVGIGGLPDREGHVTLDACIMDQDSRCGSVMGVEHIVNVISLARRVMEKTPHVILVGDGALQFALDQGFPKTNLLTPKSEALWKEWLKTSNYQPRLNIENELYKKDPAAAAKWLENLGTIRGIGKPQNTFSFEEAMKLVAAKPQNINATPQQLAQQARELMAAGTPGGAAVPRVGGSVDTSNPLLTGR
jgi:hypothetical protein